MRLDLSTWPDIESYLQRRTDVVIPVGSTEQHGRFGLLGTDTICPSSIAQEAGVRTGALVAPTLNFGVAQHHMAFPGTMSLKASTFAQVILELIESLAQHGFTDVLFVNGHGGNIGAMQSAFNDSYARVTSGAMHPIALRLHNWWEGERVDSVRNESFGDKEGQHATCSELSLTWHVHPECAQAPSEPQVEPTFTEIRDAEDFRRRYPNGAMGADASLCSAQAGAMLHEAAVEDLIAVINAEKE